ncbi:unnamed protein product [Ectocarpus sp. 4 AP-2014]
MSMQSNILRRRDKPVKETNNMQLGTFDPAQYYRTGPEMKKKPKPGRDSASYFIGTAVEHRLLNGAVFLEREKFKPLLCFFNEIFPKWGPVLFHRHVVCIRGDMTV